MKLDPALLINLIQHRLQEMSWSRTPTRQDVISLHNDLNEPEKFVQTETARWAELGVDITQ